MIDKKVIEHAADIAAQLHGGSQQVKTIFRIGAEWAEQQFLQDLWHEGIEVPSNNSDVVIVTTDKTIKVFRFYDDNHKNNELSQMSIEKWLYLNDLL